MPDLREYRMFCLWKRGLGLLGALAIAALAADAPVANSASDVAYKNYRMPSGPFSIHVVRVPRNKTLFEVQTVHAQGSAVGLDSLSEQVRLLDSASATAVAGINGDFYLRDGAYAGDPRGLQIVNGELISAPAGSASFWIDAPGDPHTSITVSEFQVTWPDGKTSPIGLNGRREPAEIELYTPAFGPSTHTVRGRELVLEQQGNSSWLPLRPARVYRARVREVRESGDSRIRPGTMVLSLGPIVVRTAPRIEAGAELLISTATSPSLKGARTAISGGPVLVANGKRQPIKGGDSGGYQFSSMTERHPRSAIGWNDESFFLVEVDGRQQLSAGMTLNELAAFLVELGCREAMNLDGGGSATLWFDGKVRNRPCEGGERPVANALVVLKKKNGSSEKAQAGTTPSALNP